MIHLIHQLEATRDLPDEQLLALIACEDEQINEYLAQRARAVRQSVYGDEVYIRGLIEFTNYCKNDCRYCGIRRSNDNCQRYRLSQEEILDCCRAGYELGFRTFVLQGGEDGWYTRDRMTQMIRAIRADFPDCAITLSVGERDRDTYQQWFDAGANRYLLRHETANEPLYRTLHPAPLSLKERMDCLYALKEIGYQVGCGFMVGVPGQTNEMLVEDLRFIQQFGPHMVGIGPFVPHCDTQYCHQPAGSARLTLRLLAILRLMHPQVLLPATTALGTVMGDGRQQGMLYGCNVVMPNLSPEDVRAKYALYDNKLSSGQEAAQCVAELARSMESIGYRVVTHRGDWKGVRVP